MAHGRGDDEGKSKKDRGRKGFMGLLRGVVRSQRGLGVTVIYLFRDSHDELADEKVTGIKNRF